MNNQIPYGFMPPFNFDKNETKQINDKIDYLEKRIKKLEKKIELLENNNYKPYPIFPNNYSM